MIKVQVMEIYSKMHNEWSQELVFTKDNTTYIGEKFIKHIPTDGITFDTICNEKCFPDNAPIIDIIRCAYNMRYPQTGSDQHPTAFKEMLVFQNAAGFSDVCFAEHERFDTDKLLFKWLSDAEDLPEDF